MRTQTWIAFSVYLLAAIIKMRLQPKASLYTVLQVLSVTAFDKTPLDQLIAEAANTQSEPQTANQLDLLTETLVC